MTAKAMVMCAVKGSKEVFIKPGVVPIERECHGGCGSTVLLSESSLRIPNADYFCNDCGKAALAAQALQGNPFTLGIAPGALPDPTGPDKRRRNELEAHGFKQFTDADMEELHGG